MGWSFRLVAQSFRCRYDINVESDIDVEVDIDVDGRPLSVSSREPNHLITCSA